ncbi:MAG: tRNA pseudouridine(38-40) synthase TruA [Bacteroidales bacterium]|jgi:tRNA pseudouridine38-40 synthase|nr:tRNA pseudouridine(38-40) synthase TruA [Bacteroidales bacterium]
MRYFLHLSYKGANFFGWQVQNDTPTVEATIEKSISLILSATIDLTGCGRTDTGVNAKDFYAHFDYIEMTDDQINTLIRKLNSFLSQDIRIFGIYRVKNDANARFDALSRTYKYYVSMVKQPFDSEFCLYYPYVLDVDLMNEAAKTLLGYEDFTSFSKQNTQTKTNNCKITQANWQSEGEILVFTITANRFLRNMVRAIVGTLLDVGRKKISAAEFAHIIESKHRSNASTSVLGKALFLYKVTYPQDIFL